MNEPTSGGSERDTEGQPEVSGEASAPRAAPAPLRIASWALLLVGAALLGGVAATCAGSLIPEPPSLPPMEETETVVRETPDVVAAMRDLARLETAEAHIERVIDLRDRQRRAFGLVEAEDVILLVAAGDVQAGVDLQDLEPGDVVVDQLTNTVTLRLPAAQVFQTRLDNDRTYVHTRQTDTFARRSRTLETRARQEAERTMEAAAVEAGLLMRAQANAEVILRTLLEGLGFSVVVVEWRG